MHLAVLEKSIAVFFERLIAIRQSGIQSVEISQQIT
jgi:hypothetical protein